MEERNRRVKIVATLGPASATVEQKVDLIKAGVNIFRENMSHGTHEQHAESISNVRKASEVANQEVGILLDLQGPKIRVDKLEEPLELADGDTWVIGETKYMNDYPEYKGKYIPTIYDQLVDDCKAGERVLFDDGLMVAETIGKDRNVIKIKILVGGALKSNKGINLPDSDVSAPSFTAKDREDFEFGVTQDVDYIALSFVRSGQDIVELKDLLREKGKNIPIIAKIEKPQALTNIDEILEVVDVIMVARGDMAVEIGNHLVPPVQKDLIRRCNKLGIPIITATQMLESMISNPSPTRAEASDVANAVWDGTDAVMLSAESAAGKYPVEAVTMMAKIVVEAEKTPVERPLLRNMDLSSISASTMVAGSMIAEKTDSKKIIVITNTGNSARQMAHFRPTQQVIGVTDRISAARRMCLYWGITPIYLKDFDETKSEDIEADVLQEVKKHYQMESGDKVVIVKGDEKFFRPGSSNTVKTEIIK